ncbi:MAG: tRNA (adenosine(37)-N6)-dimethylallyltransferase MiaA [Bacteroidota bacterium]|nr:tRNA (adenosine(37)-N6)-dimethylallyltransferase MiaA [Bacteroidota bacterium]
MALTKNKKIIIVAGPTAAGKTGSAIEIAKHFKTEIISADSRQCFQELNIGVARPSEGELRQVKHHFIASHSVQDEVNAVVFEQYALKKINELFKENDTVVMVGGTGLYIKAFCEGLDDIPMVKTGIRNRINAEFEEKGLSWLQEEIKSKDPEFYKAGEIQNPQRVMRALEVIESTGESVLHFRKGEKIKRDFGIVKIGLELPKEQLHQNINTRVDRMIENGLVEEVKKTEVFKHLNALQTVGYSEIFNYLDGRISLEQAIHDIKTSTRQYAKRQMTWFRKDKEIKWFAPDQLKEIIEFAKKGNS